MGTGAALAPVLAAGGGWALVIAPGIWRETVTVPAGKAELTPRGASGAARTAVITDGSLPATTFLTPGSTTTGATVNRPRPPRPGARTEHARPVARRNMYRSGNGSRAEPGDARRKLCHA